MSREQLEEFVKHDSLLWKVRSSHLSHPTVVRRKIPTPGPHEITYFDRRKSKQLLDASNAPVIR